MGGVVGGVRFGLGATGGVAGDMPGLRVTNGVTGGVVGGVRFGFGATGGAEDEEALRDLGVVGGVVERMGGASALWSECTVSSKHLPLCWL